MSNHPDVLNNIPKKKLLCQNIRLDFNSEITERALRLLWDIKNDKLIFQLLLKSLPNNKRGILSLVASIFDPLGIVTPAVLAVTAVKLKDKIVEIFDIQFVSINFWVDSFAISVMNCLNEIRLN